MSGPGGGEDRRWPAPGPAADGEHPPGLPEPTGARGRVTVLSCLAVLAGSSSLHAMFSGDLWWPASAAAAVVVAGLGAAGRRLRLPVLLSPLLALVGLLLLSTVLFARAHAVAGFIPTGRSLAQLQHLFSSGVSGIPHFFSPSVPGHALLLLTVVGVGVIALAVDLIAVTGERPALAGIPLLALVTLPAGARTGGIGLWPFVITAIAYLALLAFESGEHSQRWGRSLTGPESTSLAADAGGSATGWRIGAVTLVTAMALPLLIPGGRHNPFITGPGGSSGDGSANSSTVVIDPFVSISASLHAKTTYPLLDVQTNEPVYLRLTALESLGDDGFSLEEQAADANARVARGIPAPDTGSTAILTDPVQEQITATKALTERFLPVPQDPVLVSVPGDWRLAEPTQTIFASRTTTSGLTWQVTAAVPAPTPAVLRASGPLDDPSSPYPDAVQADVGVPPSLPSVVATTAAAWVKSAGALTAYDAVLAIEQQLRGPTFTYDIKAQVVSGPQGYVNFLQQRRGFCQQFATTMAAMVRTLGLPSRVAIGFTPGTSTGNGNYTVTNQDAHAWPEVWFPTAGWVRFEPTPLATGRGLTPSYAPTTGGIATATNPNPTTPDPGAGATGPAASGSKGGTGFFDKSDTLNHLTPDPGSPTPPAAAVSPDHRVRDQLIALAIALVVLAGLAAPATSRVRAGRRRRRVGAAQQAAAVWAGLLDEARDCGVRCPSAASPRAVGRAVRAAFSRAEPAGLGASAGAGGSGAVGGSREAGPALDRLVTAIETARYAPASAVDVGTGAPDQALATSLLGRAGSDLESDLALVRKGLRASLPFTAQLRVLLLPASGVARATAPAARVAAFGGVVIDSSAGALTRVLRRRPTLAR